MAAPRAAKVAEIVAARGREFDCVNASTALQCFSRLAGPRPVASEVELLMSQVRLHLHECRPHSLTITLWSMAKLMLHDQPLRNAISTSALSLMQEFDARHLARLVWACAQS